MKVKIYSMITEIKEKDFLKLRLKLSTRKLPNGHWEKVDVMNMLRQAKEEINKYGGDKKVAVFYKDRSEPYSYGPLEEKTFVCVPGAKHIYQKRNWYETLVSESGGLDNYVMVPKRGEDDQIYLVYVE